MSDVREIRRILNRRFIDEVRRQGEENIAKAIEEVLALLNVKNAELARGKEVTELSRRVKSEARVTVDDGFFITTVFPEWYVKGKEGKILEEQAEKGPVYVMITEGVKYPPDKIVKDMRKRGIIVRSIPGTISTNISKETVTLYYAPNPCTPHYSDNRIAIHLQGKPGKVLANRFMKVRPLWALDHRTIFGPPLREFAVLRALDSILRNSKEKKILEDAVRHDVVPPSHRILLGLYLLQNEKNRPYETEEIAKKVGLEYLRVNAEIMQWRSNQAIGPKRFEFYRNSETGLIEKIWLVPQSMYQVIPLTLTQTILYLYAESKDIQMLVDKYHLPPSHNSTKLFGILR